MDWIACLASSWDGKITAANSGNNWVKLGSNADLKHLFHLRGAVQAVLFGAKTLKAWAGVHVAFVDDKPVSVPPIHVVLTRRWQLPWAAPLFCQWQADWPPLLIASASSPPKEDADLQALLNNGLVRWLPLSERHPETHCKEIEAALTLLGVKRLLVEGGGEVLATCLKAKVLQELYLTLTPWLVGGTQTPSLVGGEGLSSLLSPLSCKLKNIKVNQAGDELYLHAEVSYL
jgi:5-amino-6-(5-phosphoribosylamino)uracil reductase